MLEVRPPSMHCVIHCRAGLNPIAVKLRKIGLNFNSRKYLHPLLRGVRGVLEYTHECIPICFSHTPPPLKRGGSYFRL